MDNKEEPPRILNKNWWGPRWWQYIHVWAFTLPENLSDEEQINAERHIQSWIRSIPCIRCRVHTATYFSEHKADLRTREGAARSLVEYHNRVNQTLGKPQMSFDSAVKFYMAPVVVPSTDNTRYLMWAAISLLALVALYKFAAKKPKKQEE